MPLSDYAARAAILQREVEALARMTDQGSPHDAGALTSVPLIPRSAGGGLPWLSSVLPGPSSASSAPQRRDLSRERAERRALSAPIPPRNAPRARGGAAAGMAERSRAARVSLNDSTGSTPSDPTPPKTPGSEGGDHCHLREGGTSDAAGQASARGADCVAQSWRLDDVAVDGLEDGQLHGERGGLANVRWTDDEWCHRLERKKTVRRPTLDQDDHIP